MKLPQSFTTVTPFSKMVALSLFIILPIAAFFWGMQYQQLIESEKPQQIIVQYKVPNPSSSPIPSKSRSQTVSCNTKSDCPSGYYCASVGPIVYNPKNPSVGNRKTCHKKGTMVPM